MCRNHFVYAIEFMMIHLQSSTAEHACLTSARPKNPHNFQFLYEIYTRIYIYIYERRRMTGVYACNKLRSMHRNGFLNDHRQQLFNK